MLHKKDHKVAHCDILLHIAEHLSVWIYVCMNIFHALINVAMSSHKGMQTWRDHIDTMYDPKRTWVVSTWLC